MSGRTRAGRVGRIAATVAAVMVAALLAAPAATAQRPQDDGSGSGYGGLGRFGMTKTPARAAAVDAAVARTAPSADAAARLRTTTPLTPCADDAPFLCTTVPVPLDRRHPDGRTVALHVEVFPHTGATPHADGAVLITCGGPGCSISSPDIGAKYGYSFFLLPQIAETRDLVFVDQRGVGLSDVIDCPALQAGRLFHLYPDARACHDQLGSAANLYSTTDVADDLEDVRAALGYDHVDLFGGSYAGDDMLTYAVRHTAHVRSMILSSPALAVGVDPFYSYAPEAMPAVVATICRRSDTCSVDHRRPAREFARLLRTLRHHPVTGTGIDSAGERHPLEVRENNVSNFIMYQAGSGQDGPAELTAAAAALRHGDARPLLRLAADSDPANGFGDDPRSFSNGHNLARNCVDAELPFDQDAPAEVRARQFEAAYAAEPRRYGVVSKQAWAAPDWFGWQPSACISARWQKRPMYPAGTTLTGVPTLVLGGEYDLPVPEAVSRMVSDVVPAATYVSMSGAGHDPQFWSDCGPELVQRFYRDLAVGDTSCADRPALGTWAPGRFATRLHQARPATQTGGPASGRRERRLMTVTAWTAMDALRHSFLTGAHSVGLRGGSVDYAFVDGVNQWKYSGVRFTRDVAIRGLVSDPSGQGDFVGDLSVRQRRATPVTVHLAGPLFSPGAQAVLTTRVRGRTATFVVPAN